MPRTARAERRRSRVAVDWRSSRSRVRRTRAAVCRAVVDAEWRRVARHSRRLRRIARHATSASTCRRRRSTCRSRGPPRSRPRHSALRYRVQRVARRVKVSVPIAFVGSYRRRTSSSRHRRRRRCPSPRPRRRRPQPDIAFLVCVQPDDRQRGHAARRRVGPRRRTGRARRVLSPCSARSTSIAGPAFLPRPCLTLNVPTRRSASPRTERLRGIRTLAACSASAVPFGPSFAMPALSTIDSPPAFAWKLLPSPSNVTTPPFRQRAPPQRPSRNKAADDPHASRHSYSSLSLGTTRGRTRFGTRTEREIVNAIYRGFTSKKREAQRPAQETFGLPTTNTTCLNAPRTTAARRGLSATGVSPPSARSTCRARGARGTCRRRG